MKCASSGAGFHALACSVNFGTTLDPTAGSFHADHRSKRREPGVLDEVRFEIRSSSSQAMGLAHADVQALRECVRPRVDSARVELVRS